MLLDVSGCACSKNRSELEQSDSPWLKQIHARRKKLAKSTTYGNQAETLPPSRPCCILAPSVSPFGGTDNFVDPSALGVHGRSEANGLVYCGKAGFVDLGHLRETCDLTKHIHDEIIAASGSPLRIATVHGNATFKVSPVSSLFMDIAMTISFLDGSFNTAVTRELTTLLPSLGAQPISESLRAFNSINHKWVEHNSIASLSNKSYLKRRNFTRAPWKTGHSSDAPTPSWITTPLFRGSHIYDYTHTHSRSISASSFPAEIRAIRTKALASYGSNFDKP